MAKTFNRLSLGTQFTLLLVALFAFVAAAGTIVSRSIVESQVLNEGRSIADMTEHIGSWASQYGGVHVRSASQSKTAVGSFLEQKMYAADLEDHLLLAGARLASTGLHAGAARRVESYYWKNPALIQREVSQIAVASPAKAKFRITAATVLNPNNKPDAFELRAIEAINAQPASPPATSRRAAARATSGPAEYWTVQGNQMRYARAIVAAESCLRCHESREKAPAFLLANAEFNGGGGFGYETGKAAGIISVTLPVPETTRALAASMTSTGWAALAAIFIVCVLILVFVLQKVIRPLNRLRAYADSLANAALGENVAVPEFAKGDARSGNEIHRLSAAVAELGQSVTILFRKLQKARS